MRKLPLAWHKGKADLRTEFYIKCSFSKHMAKQNDVWDLSDNPVKAITLDDRASWKLDNSREFHSWVWDDLCVTNDSDNCNLGPFQSGNHVSAKMFL